MLSLDQLVNFGILLFKLSRSLAYFHWEILFHGSLMFVHDLWRGTDCLCSVSTTFSAGVKRDSIFLWRETHLITVYCNEAVSFQSKGKSCLLHRVKNWRFQGSEFLSYNSHIIWPSSYHLVRTGVQRLAQMITV